MIEARGLQRYERGNVTMGSPPLSFSSCYVLFFSSFYGASTLLLLAQTLLRFAGAIWQIASVAYLDSLCLLALTAVPI